MAYAEPEAESDPWGYYGNLYRAPYYSAYRYGVSPYLGYRAYGYRYLGKREAESEPESQPDSDPLMYLQTSPGASLSTYHTTPLVPGVVHPNVAVRPYYNTYTLPYTTYGAHIIGKRDAEPEPWGYYRGFYRPSYYSAYRRYYHQ